MRVHTTILFSLGVALLLFGCAPKRRPGTVGNGRDGSVNAGDSDAGDNGNGGTGGGGGGPSDEPDFAGRTEDGCPQSSPTAVTGRVLAPNGTLPLYNATVYVPSGTPPAFKEGVSCDRCGEVGSHAVTVTQTDAKGAFKLINVPAGDNVQVVIEMGKWRRIATVPKVTRCQTVALIDDQSRLPRTKAEGNMPQLAISTGQLDPFECLLLKIGIDKSEFTAPSGAGRVHFFQAATQPGSKLATDTPKADDATNGLFAKAENLRRYDVILLPCEGNYIYEKTTDAQRAMLVPYLDAGGRLFATHFSYNWLTYPNSPYDAIGKWNVNQMPMDDTTGGTLDQSFPKGKAFADWLHNVDMTVNGAFQIQDPRYDLDGVEAKYAQRWIAQTSGQHIMHTTFNTPLDPPKDKDGKPQYCGRVVFSDFHVSADALKEKKKSDQIFPDACVGGDMTTQEKALAFMLFDLSSCVIPDTQPPIP